MATKADDGGMKSLLEDRVRKSRWPARLDLWQSLTGLILAVFMWGHLLLVSSILFGKDAMMNLTHFMEAGFLKPDQPGGYPILVAIAAGSIFALFILHAALALRKFPINWKQHKELRSQMKMLKHSDTTAWYTQVITGFIMFFLGSVHLFIMMSQPENIGPYASSDRIWTLNMWPLYLVLLFAVEIHGAVGMYRLAVKWGIFDGKNPRQTRQRLKRVKTLVTVFFLALGLTSLAAYMKIGRDHADRFGERYISGHVETPAVSTSKAGEDQ
jgi:fumarate reductase subunit C